MGCGWSKFSGEEEGLVVSVCRERKQMLKSAMERRHRLALAHRNYIQSLRGVATAIRVFVARHSSPTSPFLITFPRQSKTGTFVSSPMHLPQAPSESVVSEAAVFKQLDSAVPSHSLTDKENGAAREDSGVDDDDDDEEEEEEVSVEEGGVCEHFYDDRVGPPDPSPQNDSGWDFFNLFDGGVCAEGSSGFSVDSSDGGGLKSVRKAEKSQQLGEDEGKRDTKVREVGVGDGEGESGKQIGPEGTKEVVDANGIGREELRDMDTTADGRELLEALKDVEDHLMRAYESGLDFSKMLETYVVDPQTGEEELKDSNKSMYSITLSRSVSSLSSSCKSSLSCSSKSSSMWTELSDHLFDQSGGMESGSHLFTLGRLYAWEKKLYEEVKAGEQARKSYQRKCTQLSKKDNKGDSLDSGDRTSNEVRDLFSKISVSLRISESISKRIHKLRDEELLPQLVELLRGMNKMWTTMFELHQIQKRTLTEVKCFSCPAFGKLTDDSHHLATLQLQAEVQNWQSCFAEYISTQKAYIEALHGWLSKFVAPEMDFCPSSASSIQHCWRHTPLINVICHRWSASLQLLPDSTVAYAMKSFGKDVRAMLVQQRLENQQKRKVDRLSEDLEKKTLMLQRVERKFLELKPSDQMTELDTKHRAEHLVERKIFLDVSRNRLEAERVKQNNDIQKTQMITMNGFQTGFAAVFEALAEFSRASIHIYDDIVAHYQKTEAAN